MGRSELKDTEVDELQSRLAGYLERKGLRSTNQRRLVSEVFFRSNGHLSIDDVLTLAREQDPGLGYATVYRTLKLLVECGLASERHFENAVTRYEVTTGSEHHHDHLICVECRRIVEFEDEAIESAQDEVAARHGFTLVSHKHELYGVCAQCRLGN